MSADRTVAWNSHYNCHCAVVSRAWRGDYCAAYQTRAFGGVAKDIIDVYAYNPQRAMRAGALRYQFSTAFRAGSCGAQTAVPQDHLIAEPHRPWKST